MLAWPGNGWLAMCYSSPAATSPACAPFLYLLPAIQYSNYPSPDALAALEAAFARPVAPPKGVSLQPSASILPPLAQDRAQEQAPAGQLLQAANKTGTAVFLNATRDILQTSAMFGLLAR